MAGTEPKIPNLIVDAPLCYACKKQGSYKCADCGDARYCSSTCLEKDWPLHKHLCDAFSMLKPQPTPKHYRTILFPNNSNKLHFVWIPDRSDEAFHALTKQFTNTDHPVTTRVDHFSTRSRALGHKIEVLHHVHSMVATFQSNQAIARLFRVEYLSTSSAHHVLVYGRQGTALVNLGTSAIAPILDGLRHAAKMEGDQLRRKLKVIEVLAKDIWKDSDDEDMDTL
jgi:hypothetical protein